MILHAEGQINDVLVRRHDVCRVSSGSGRQEIVSFGVDQIHKIEDKIVVNVLV